MTERDVTACSAAALLLACLASVLPSAPLAATAPKFYVDDPLLREPETADASGAQPFDISLGASLLFNLFSSPGDSTPDVRARNVNTIDEVPDSSWFTNRIYAKPVSAADVRRGANTIDGPARGRWTVIGPKTSGAAPGFRIRDEAGETWFVSLDSKQTPVAATAAIAVACRLFWALGYFQVESYLTSFQPDQLHVAETAMISTQANHQRPMTMNDVDMVLGRAARNADGSYRVLAARVVPGRVLGGFPYVGTRPDDPNDIVPHEHRRELRALKVFGAWTNLVDMKSLNTLDTVITDGTRGVVRHYLQDVGSTFGTGAAGPHDWPEGYEYLYDGGLLWKRLVTLNFYLQPWQLASYEKNDQVGRFEGDTFDPERWVARAPIAPVRRARDDDNFWAALRVAAFSDELIRAAVREGRYTDPAAETLLGDVLIKRRDKIARVYLTKLNPLVGFELDSGNTLTFENAAVRAGVAQPPSGGYRATWYRFDNMTRDTLLIGDSSSPSEQRLSAPRSVSTDAVSHRYLKVAVSAIDPAYPSWAFPTDVYFRRIASGWKLVGVERPAAYGDARTPPAGQ